MQPGEIKTYQFTIQASNNLNGAVSATPGYTTPLAAGTNNLTFDVVYEAKFWFASNSNGAGPGNVVFKTSAQTVALSVPPTAVTPSTGLSICAGSAIALNSTSSGNVIDWYTTPKGGTKIGSSNSGANFSVSPIANTTYYAESRNPSGCVSVTRTSSALITVNPVPGIALTKVDKTCPATNDGTITPTLSGGLTNIRYIKLTQKFVNQDAWQQVQEIQAFEIFSGTNVALAANGATATASSVYNNDNFNYGPQKVIDDITTSTNFWHSNSPNINESITVDLKTARNLKNLRIFNRSDCCYFRGQNMLLELFDESNKLIFSKTLDLWGNVNGANSVTVDLLNVSWSDNVPTLKRIGLTTGTYTLNYSDATGCSASSSAVIGNTNMSATAGAASSKPILCLNSPLTTITHSTTGVSVITSATGLPSGVTATFASNTIRISGTPTTTGIFNYTIVGTGPCGSVNATGTITVSASTSTQATRYISNVQFVGTLNSDTNKSSVYSTPGYSNFKAESSKALQIPGGVINLKVNVIGPANDPLSTIKAWVDWNQNGVFEISEKIYDTQTVGALTGNVIFGFPVPVTISPGTYTIRLKASAQTESNFGPCDNLTSGETEDYSFDVIADCIAKISSVSAAKQCGAGTVLLKAVGNSVTSSYLRYDSEFGNAIAGEVSTSYTTSSLGVGRYTYYVTASNGSCNSAFRTPVTVVVSPTPTITFTKSQPDICGESSNLKVTSSGDQEEVNLLQENFDDSQNLQFKSEIEKNADVNAMWAVRSSPFISKAPPYNTTIPAVSSGYNGGNFAHISTDVKQISSVLNHLVLKKNLNTTGFTDLKLDFDLYYFSEEDIAEKNYFKVQYSLTNGATWVDLETFLTDQGVRSRFKRVSLVLPPLLEEKTELKLRFSLFALGTAKTDGTVLEWIADVVSIDNVRLYGNKALNTPFTWASSNVSIYNEDCTTLYNGASKSVCIIPTKSQMEQSEIFSVTANATLSNGCLASATTTIINSNKIWNHPGKNNWSEATDWKPAGANAVPTADKCVIIKTPVKIAANTLAFAKNVLVENTGQLTISGRSSLTVTDALVNMATADKVVVESEGGLIQINNSPTLNTGNITAKRELAISTNRQQYNYVISPLEGQSLKTVYPGIDFVLYHNEANNYFGSSTGAYIKGRGLALKEPNKTGIAAVNTSVAANFTGYPTNGNFTYNIVNSKPGVEAPSTAVRGYNLIGNPYPSNIDLNLFFALNGGKAGTLSPSFYFWDSTVNDIYVQQGSNYGGQSYGQFNAVAPPGIGTGLPATGDINKISLKTPTRIVKMGQAFMARSKAATTTLLFDNTIRSAEIKGDSFFGKETTTSPDRYWLRLISPTGVAVTIAMVYFPGGDNGLADDDSFSMGGSDVLYSVVDGQKIAINGRSTFTDTDVISLGTTHFGSGNYTFSLGEKEGVFANGQNIYLKDRLTNTLTNLSEVNYVFEASAGESTSRFEIVYRPENVLSTEGSVKEDIVIYRDSDDFIVRSSGKKITAVEVYDTSGRLVLSVAPDKNEVRLDTKKFATGVYLLKINRNGEISSKKVIR